MGLYRELDFNTPLGTSNIRDGDNEILAVKQALRDQWPNWTAQACTPTVPQINQLADLSTSQTIEQRLALLEDKAIIQQLPSQARDFNNAWWQSDGNTVPERLWAASATRNDFENVPWPWGNGIQPPNSPTDLVAVFVERIVGLGGSVHINRVTVRWEGSSGAFTGLFWRYAISLAGITAATWHRATFTTIDSAENSSGDILTASARTELEDGLNCTGLGCP